MKKLTPEQIERIIDENFGFANVKEAMLFMQDEVLRLNGWRPIETAPKDGTTILASVPFTKNSLAVLWAKSKNYEGWMLAWDSSTLERGAERPTHWLPMPPVPHVTGCPDTMDDTAQYAVDQKAAGEEKSPPATGPAG